MEFLANSKGQSLVKHNIVVGKFAKVLFNILFKKEKYEDVLSFLNMDGVPNFSYKNIEKIVLFSGFYHDIGKLDPNFQDYIRSNNNENNFDVQIETESFDVETYPLHHEISFALLSSLDDTQTLKPFLKNTLLYSVYFHHANPFRAIKNNFDNAYKILTNNGFNFSLFLNNFQEYKNSFNTLLNEENLLKDECEDHDDILERSKTNMIPKFQSAGFLKNKEGEQSEFFKNSLTFLIRSILISADRVVSGISCEMMNKIIEDNDYNCLLSCLTEKKTHLITDIEDMLKTYPVDQRSMAQSKVAKELSVNDIMVLKGPAGVGKTKIMLEWIKNIDNKKRNIVIVPKLSIAEGLFDELRSNYLPDVNIEILTGEKKLTSKNNIISGNEDLFEADIIITTIDQIVNLMLSHKKIDLFLETLNCNLIFDEFHEFMGQPAILMLFIQIINLKRLCNNSHALLVSATPNVFLVKNKLKIASKNIKTISSFNETNYEINLIQFNDARNIKEINNKMFEKQESGTICIFNTAKKAQLSAIRLSETENDTLVYHSKFLDKDKREIKNKIFKEFGKKNPTKMNVLRTGPILQASVDISASEMHTEISNIDDVFQRMGRLVRWSEATNGVYNIYIPTDLTNLQNSILFGLQNMSCLRSSLKFIAYLQLNESKIKNITLNDFYMLYDEFFANRENHPAFDADFEDIKEKAAVIFENDFTPIKTVSINKKSDKKVSQNSIRGVGGYFCFVNDLMVENGKETIKTGNVKDNTISVNVRDFYGYENLVKYAEESRDQIVKHGKNQVVLSEVGKNIKKYSYSARKKLKSVSPNIILSLAKNNDAPLFLSFKENTKKIDSSEQFVNLVYNGVKIGVVRKGMINND